MTKKLIGLFGLILFLLCLSFGFWLWQQEKLAHSRDKNKIAFGNVAGIPFCDWDIKPPDRVISEQKSQAIVINIKNTAGSACQSNLTLTAPGFDVSPSSNERSMDLKSKSKGSLAWILTPRNAGDYEITVSDMLNTKVTGVTVTNIFGLTSLQAQIASIFGTLFGPMLTIPWWMDKMYFKKKQENKPHSETPQST